MKKIYVVTSGSYSDYHIEGVFNNEELARSVAERLYDACVEEYVINGMVTNGNKLRYKVLLFDDSGEHPRAHVNTDDAVEDSWNGIFKYSVWRSLIEINVVAENEERAIKIASERYMQIKAEPYLFPRWNEECIKNKYGHNERLVCPTYNFFTHELLLSECEEMVDLAEKNE